MKGLIANGADAMSYLGMIDQARLNTFNSDKTAYNFFKFESEAASYVAAHKGDLRQLSHYVSTQGGEFTQQIVHTMFERAKQENLEDPMVWGVIGGYSRNENIKKSAYAMKAHYAAKAKASGNNGE